MKGDWKLILVKDKMSMLNYDLRVIAGHRCDSA